MSDDSVRRDFVRFDETETLDWLDRHLGHSGHPVLALGPWILNKDNTVKPLYGKHVAIGLWRLFGRIPRE